MWLLLLVVARLSWASSLEYWPADVVQQPLADGDVMCQVGQLVKAEVSVRITGHHSVWVVLRADDHERWELDNGDRAPFELQAGTEASAVRIVTWRLLREPALHGNNHSVAMELPPVVAHVALSAATVSSSPLRTLRSAPVTVTLRLQRPRDTLRYVAGALAACVVCWILYSVALRKVNALERLLGKRLEEEQRRANVAPDAVVGGVRIFSGKGKTIKRFGPKKE